MATDHAPIAPSALSLTVECPGWIQLAATLPPEPEGPEAAEGTAGHEVALAAVDGLPMAVGAIVGCNGLRVTQEMLDGAELWASVVPEGAICEEKLAHITRIHATECSGTPDAWKYFPPLAPTGRGKLWLADYKFGHGYVEAFELWQAIAYIVGILEKLGLSDTDIDCEFVIVQPRCYVALPVRSWHFKAIDIRAHVNIAMQRAHEALGASPRTIAGSHCMTEHCPARRACKTLQEAGAEIIDFVGTSEPGNLEGPALAFELMLLQRVSKMIEARQTGLEAQAKAMLESGKHLPGVTLERSQARLKWKDDSTVEEIATIGHLMGLNLVHPQELITPTQAKAKGLADGLLTQYAYRPPGAFKLKLDPDNISTRKAFGANKHD